MLLLCFDWHYAVVAMLPFVVACSGLSWRTILKWPSSCRLLYLKYQNENLFKALLQMYKFECKPVFLRSVILWPIISISTGAELDMNKCDFSAYHIIVWMFLLLCLHKLFRFLIKTKKSTQEGFTFTRALTELYFSLQNFCSAVRFWAAGYRQNRYGIIFNIKK